MTRKTVQRGNITRYKILKTGLEMWEKDPSSVNAHAISKNMNIVHGTVMYHFPDGVRNAVALHAVDVGNHKVMAQLIVEGHPAVAGLNPADKKEILSSV
jgi:hypothetical protein